MQRVFERNPRKPGPNVLSASIFSVSKAREDAVGQYINGQADHHKRQSFLEELAALLEKHGVPFDPRYLGAD